MATDWIMTASGRAFYPTRPRSEDIDITDIAHALAAVNRFNGHTREPYSVAQHSVLVSHEMERRGGDLKGDFVGALFGLLHDASEAYLSDIPRPVKRMTICEPYRTAEAILQSAIYRRFGLDPDQAPDALKVVDRRMLRTEQHFLMPPAAHGEDRKDVEPFGICIRPWGWSFARESFLRRFDDLTTAVRENAC